MVLVEKLLFSVFFNGKATSILKTIMFLIVQERHDRALSELDKVCFRLLERGYNLMYTKRSCVHHSGYEFARGETIYMVLNPSGHA